MAKLNILLVLSLIFVCAHGKADDPPAMDYAMQANQASISLAANGDMRARDAADASFRATVAGVQGDKLSAYRLSAGLGRKLLREATQMPHNPDLLAATATQAAQGAVMEAVETQNAQKAAAMGHVYGQNAAIADSYDAWQMLSGRGKRRLGEQALVDPTITGGLSAQAAVRAATTGGGDVQRATQAAQEAVVLSAVGDFSATRHAASGRLNEGPLSTTRQWQEATPAPELDWPHRK